MTNRAFQFAWNTLLLLATTVVCIEVPYHVVAGWVHGVGTTTIGSAQTIVTIIFIADIAVNLRRPFYREGRLITDPQKIRKHYLSGPIVTDVIAAIPYNLVLDAAFGSGATPLLDLILLLRVAKLPRLVSWFQDNLPVNHSIVRLGLFAYVISLTSHWIACGWYVLTVAKEAKDHVGEYITALYWTITTLTTVGYGDLSPDLENNTQKIFGMAVMILGVAVYGYIIGNISSLFANLDLAKSQHAERVATVNEFMVTHKIPAELQGRVKSYFTYAWATNRGHQYDDVIASLPDNLQAEFAMFLNRDIIQKVPLFDDADEEMLCDIARSLQSCVYLPGDKVMRHGEMGTKMYFVSKGGLDVLDSKARKLGGVSEGGYFGELALLEERPRNATVVATDFCELYSLDKEDFDDFVLRHPTFGGKVKDRAKEILAIPRHSMAAQS